MSTPPAKTSVAPCLEVGDEALVRLKPSADENYQDSVVLVWWDAANQIGGFHRLGHEVSKEKGNFATLWTNIVTPTGIFKRTQSIPLREQDNLPGGGFGCGDDTCTVEYKDGQHIWTINEPDQGLTARLVHKDTGPHDTDIPGVLTGTLTHAGKTYQIRNGLSIRDHGWGVRIWGAALLSHRWIVGTAGSDFSIIIVAWHSADDQYAKFGWVVRNKVVTAAKAIDIATYVEDDSPTNRGGKTEVELVTGEKYVINWEPVAKAFLAHHRGVSNLDRLCSFKAVGDGKEFNGFGDYENTANISAGTRKPSLMISSVNQDGFTPLTNILCHIKLVSARNRVSNHIVMELDSSYL
ncbi:hypothetical protein NM208_g2043 [Fusarium decemcellulare]|uniref:Uncharacterized protein n=1 Tax=Fusarium decemcellulare TaxID=57161 RepID=A0ACC1SU28_9HYPO|nr:hypothetical protein NM208_g2043 [Fusarium decemcellulare]